MRTTLVFHGDDQLLDRMFGLHSKIPQSRPFRLLNKSHIPWIGPRNNISDITPQVNWDWPVLLRASIISCWSMATICWCISSSAQRKHDLFKYFETDPWCLAAINCIHFHIIMLSLTCHCLHIVFNSVFGGHLTNCNFTSNITVLVVLCSITTYICRYTTYKTFSTLLKTDTWCSTELMTVK